MATRKSQELGTLPIDRLIVKMGVPASIGILVMSVYFIVDSIFVGRFVGTAGLAALTVVMPINFLISSMGMAIGVGGASVISRALGADNEDHACRTFGNMVTMVAILVALLVPVMYFFRDPVLQLFGAEGDILDPARRYFTILLVGVPCLAYAMMSNNVMRAEGAPKMAMITMMIPAIANIVLDPVFILYFDWGIEGAAWATTTSYYLSFTWSAYYFFSGRSALSLSWARLRLRYPLVREISAIGVVTLARQGAVSLLSIVLNNSLYTYGGELAVAAYGIAGRMLMFANFPVLGVTQGFLPIVGYNYGAGLWARVQETIKRSILVGTVLATSIFALILLFSRTIVGFFTTDPALLDLAPGALVVIFLASPLITVQLIGAAYFQAIGKARPALLLTLTKQGFFLIPLILVLPLFFGLSGIWWSFPVADTLAAGVTYWYLRREVQRRLLPKLAVS